MTDDCHLCRVQHDVAHHDRIVEFEHSVAVIHREQTYRGRSLLILKPHYTRVTRVASDLFEQFNDEMRVLAGALEAAFQPDHLQYIMQGNGAAHIHWQLIPRYHHDPAWGRSAWADTAHTLMMPHERQTLAAAIRDYL